MASSFAAQLRTIAQNSTHELDLRARRTAHTESLLFPKDVAAKQDFETIYAICLPSFRELCTLDASFAEFDRNLFSAQSVRTEREQMTQAENAALDKVLGRALALLGGKLLLKPGVRCLEWLVRRFRVHVYNTSALLLAVLRWHELGVWRNVLSIVPKDKCVAEWKFVRVYKEDALNVPRAAIVHTMTTNNGFFDMMNRYVVDLASEERAHPGLLKFWAGIMLEAVVGRLDAARSGRKEIQKQNTEDLLLKVLPLLSIGLEARNCPELVMTCFTLSIVLAAKAELEDRVLDSILQAVAMATQQPETDIRAALVAMIVIISHKQVKVVQRTALEIISKIPDLETFLMELQKTFAVHHLIESILSGALTGMKQKHVTKRLALIERIVRTSINLNSETANSAFRVLIVYISRERDNTEAGTFLRDGLIELLQKLNEDQKGSPAIAEAARDLNIEVSQLETLLASAILAIEANEVEKTNGMEHDQPATNSVSVVQLLESVPSRTVETISFLGKHDTTLYEQLVECFVACCKSQRSLKKFSSLPLWHSSQHPQLLFNSLMLRVAVGPFGAGYKSAALHLLAQNMRSNELSDAHIMLPYILTALVNPIQQVRRSAADLLIVMDEVVSSDNEASKKCEVPVYDEKSMVDVKVLTTSSLHKILNQVFLPNLEECVLDASYVTQIIQSAFGGSEGSLQTPTKSSKTELKKSLRHDLFEHLVSHANQTPSTKVQTTVIHLIDSIGKVGSTGKSRALDPLFRKWLNCDEAEAIRTANAAKSSLVDIDTTMLRILSPSDREAFVRALPMFEERGAGLRGDLITAFFNRLQSVWKELKHDVQVSLAQKMFELAIQTSSPLSAGAQGLLRSVNLSTDILGTMLESAVTVFTRMQNGEEQPKKKRRTSHGRDSLPPDIASMLTSAASQLTFALELVDGSKPESRPELSPVLFEILSMIKRLKQQRINLPYLQNLCLGNLLAVVDAQKSLPKPTIDMSSIRADLITDCIRSSDNPQVQNTALLLSSSLASIAPDRMLHNVMPIFTFMSQSMFSNDDEHSVHVINQAIDKIIPALVDSVRNQNMNLVKSTSSLLASFTAAFDHIPQHRRVSTYSRLLGRMGSKDFTYIMLSLLAQRKAHHPSFDTFLVDLLAELDAETQLMTIQKLIDLANNVLNEKSQVAEDVFGIQDPMSNHERILLSKVVYGVALTVLQSKTLKAQANRLHKLDSEVAETLRSEIYACFRLILSSVRRHRKNNSDVVEEVKQCLDALLQLPSLLELFAILPQALAAEEVDEDLKPQALRVLATQLQKNPSKDKKTRGAAIALLSNLTSMLQTGTSLPMKQAIIVCIDRLSEVYGRKDIDCVISAAIAVSGDECLGSSNRHLEVMSMLSLASMLEVLQEAAIPVVPEMLHKVIEILRIITIKDGLEDEEVHNSIFALFAAVFSHIPFLVSDEYLHDILVLSGLAAPKYITPAAVASRIEAMSIIARKIDLSSLLPALLGESLNVGQQHPEDAEVEQIDMLATAIEASSKTLVIKHADSISSLLLSHLDMRSRIFSTDADITDIGESLSQAVMNIEAKIKPVFIQFIYKLNDTALRPIFETWIKWATNAYEIEDSNRRTAMLVIRKTSMFNLLTDFFETLKSIVTSYAAYIIPLSHEALLSAASTADPKIGKRSSIDMDQYNALLDMLWTTFNHDADAFYSTPSHFEPIASPLVSQLKLATSKTMRSTIYSHVIPTLVSLATATLDTPSHHQTISHDLVQLRHSSSAAVRLASIKTFAAITANENVGDDFIANVIGIGSGEGEGARGIGGGGSVGEIMIYVNEMLEDDDEHVEREVRTWVQTVREKTGEDVFEV